MSANVVLVALTAIFWIAGIYLLLDRSLTRVILGILLLGNGTNLLLLSSGGPALRAPFVGTGDPAEFSDPLAQAMILTSIVITLGLASFLLSMVYRSWQLSRDESEASATGVDDELVDDEEDRRIARLAAQDDVAGVHGDEDDDAPAEASS